MRTVNVDPSKSELTELVDALESGREDEIVLARNGIPAARIVPLRGMSAKLAGMRIQSMFTPEIERDVLALFEDNSTGQTNLLKEARLLDPKTIKTQ